MEKEEEMMIYTLIDLFSGAVLAVPLYWALEAFRGRRSLKRFCLTGLFVLYLCEMYNVVGIPAVQYLHWDPSVNLIPFADEKNFRYFFQVSMNAVMFLPFGFLLPVLWEKCRSWKVTTLAGFLTSAMIETIQLFCFRMTDADDLMMNTLGAFLGYLLSWVCFHHGWKRSEPDSTKSVSDFLMMISAILIPLLVFLLLRTPISDCIYNLIW